LFRIFFYLPEFPQEFYFEFFPGKFSGKIIHEQSEIFLREWKRGDLVNLIT